MPGPAMDAGSPRRIRPQRRPVFQVRRPAQQRQRHHQLPQQNQRADVPISVAMRRSAGKPQHHRRLRHRCAQARRHPHPYPCRQRPIKAADRSLCHRPRPCQRKTRDPLRQRPRKRAAGRSSARPNPESPPQRHPPYRRRRRKCAPVRSSTHQPSRRHCQRNARPNPGLLPHKWNDPFRFSLGRQHRRMSLRQRRSQCRPDPSRRSDKPNRVRLLQRRPHRRMSLHQRRSRHRPDPSRRPGKPNRVRLLPRRPHRRRRLRRAPRSRGQRRASRMSTPATGRNARKKTANRRSRKFLAQDRQGASANASGPLCYSGHRNLPVTVHKCDPRASLRTKIFSERRSFFANLCGAELNESALE